MKYLLKNCRLIPELSDGHVGSHSNVLVVDDCIHRICDNELPESEIEGAEVIDCFGNTLLPGLFDIHTHLNYDYYNGVLRLNDFKLLINSCEAAAAFLEYGVTTIRDMGSPKGLSVYVREAINRGLFPGPRIVTGGSILCPVRRYDEPDPNCFLRSFSGVDDLIRKIREESGRGADFIKLYYDGKPTQLLPEEMEAAVRVAHMLGKKVAVHAHEREAIQMAIKYGADTIEHGSFIEEEEIQELAEKSIYLVPTLTVLAPDVKVPGMTKEQKIKEITPFLDASAINITKAYKAGLILGFGTDTAVADWNGKAGLEFKMRKEYCGMSNIDLLLQATKYSAFICGLEDVTGEIKEGLSADLILVDGKPDEDIEVLFRKPRMVVVRGEKYI